MGRRPTHRTVRPLLVIAAAFLLCSCATGPASLPDNGPGTAYPLVKEFPDMGSGHIPHPSFPHEPYNSAPATSGPHTPYTASWGIHEEPVAEEILLHNMEHGGIIVGYNCTDCAELVNDLTDLAVDYSKMIVAPNPNLETPIVLSSWRHALYLEKLDAVGIAAIQAFIDAYYGIDHHPMGASHHMGQGRPREGDDNE